MNKYAFENLFGIEGFNIAWYGVIIAFGMMIGLLLAIKESKRQGMPKDTILDFILVALPVAIICARVYYIIFEWESYQGNPIDAFKIWNGGLAIYGGIIGGFLSAVLFCKARKLSLLKFFDIAVPSLVLGQAIGRWGNFINQEAFGNIVVNPNLQFFPYAVYIDALEEWHQATFFYESIWNFTVFGVLIFLRHRKRFDGQLLAIYFIGYGLGRFIIEGLRADSLYLVENIRVSQIVSIVLIVSGGALYLIQLLRSKASK